MILWFYNSMWVILSWFMWPRVRSVLADLNIFLCKLFLSSERIACYPSHPIAKKLRKHQKECKVIQEWFKLDLPFLFCFFYLFLSSEFSSANGSFLFLFIYLFIFNLNVSRNELHCDAELQLCPDECLLYPHLCIHLRGKDDLTPARRGDWFYKNENITVFAFSGK